jgi:hypothetical protein
LKIKETLIQESIVIHSDFGYAKADKHRENKVKKGKVEMENR